VAVLVFTARRNGIAAPTGARRNSATIDPRLFGRLYLPFLNPGGRSTRLKRENLTRAAISRALLCYGLAAAPAGRPVQSFEDDEKGRPSTEAALISSAATRRI
jgi:hypothetical protein